MGNKSNVQWEKIGVYTALLVAFWAIISQLFIIKDDITKIAERISKIEVKVEHLENK